MYLRIKELRERGKLSKKDFSCKIGIDNSQYGKIEAGKLTPTIQQVMDISSIFGVSTDWILTGKESSQKSDTYSNQLPEESKHLIPFYDDVQSIGGANGLVANMDGVSRPAEYIDAGDWFSEATAAIRHYGDSMDEYPPGCILALKEVHKIDLVVWGRNYMIETDEFRITKCLQKGGTPDYVCAYSTNKETYPDGRLKHEPIDIPKAEIHKLALVLGCVIKHSSSGVVYINDKNNKNRN